ncbi:Myosin-XV [Trachymyrmex cornetzi]|uniref:Myosin-XV n=1 Tax=Trachymyrmex cornetzi TaxID=471704 RepID=A0A151IUA1_9HYME|nr:Myosin-XV [Trachymyrmex cornetzi]
MANVDSPGPSTKQQHQQQQRRRWSMGRSSTSRSHFSLHSSEAFYASAEPLSGGRDGRALHNASSGGGPDPDSNSALDSCAPETGTRQQFRTSTRQPSRDSSDRRAIVTKNDGEIFYTVPRGLAISRKEILQRRCVRNDVEMVHPTPTERSQVEKRPTTLPSIGRRTRQDTECTSSFLKRVSRQDILRRRANVETNLQLKDVAKAPSGIPSSGRLAKEDRDISRPSTLPKILHASKTSRPEEYSSSRTRETAGREAPIYGRIRRRKMSLPTGAATSRDSTTPSKYVQDTSTKVVRHLRDPVPNPPDWSRCSNNVSRDDIYVKVTRKPSRQTPHEERLEPMDRTMSRRRIINNVDNMDSLERRMHQDRDQDVVRVKHDAILVSKADIERLRNFKTERNEDVKTSCRVDSTWSARKDSKTDSWSRNKCHPKDSTWTSERQARCRPKSQTELLTKEQTEGPKTGMKSMTLPSYVKIGRKTSTSGNLPARNVDEQRRTSTGGVLTKQSKERSNYVKKTATHIPTRIPTHIRTFSDANSARSNSPDTSSSIFGFCTGKRRLQPSSVTRRSPSWNLKTGELVWFDPGVGHVLPGEVLEYHRAANVLSVQAVIAGKPQIFTLTNLSGVKPRQDLGQNGVEDMIQLTDLNEASLLWNLKIRYDKELIYTYTGSILVAVNPYKMFDIYGLDQVKLYEGRILGTLPPHLFAVGSSAYSQVTAANNSSANQVVVISGESGSGKTESTKLVMQYLAAVNRAPNNLVTEQILEATPLLESFGNAKTPRNDNSSRFGKYLEVHFRDGAIIGGRITQYLLEKSRIVTQASEERNYHVFYELLAGLDQQLRDKYGLLTPDKYFYLNQGGNCEIDGKSDVQDFKALLSAMQVLGFSSEEQDTIFRILSSVLHLGNVYFHRKQMRHGQEGVEVGSDAEIRWAAHLLQVNSDGIIRALTTKTTEARNERVFTALNIDQALDARDAFAKALYSSLFSWLVARVNHIVYKGTKQTAAISILDIFGFENFTENSFEQLCINYANENLQFYFNKHIFKLEQQEYAKEKIDWTTINYTDNLPVIHLIAKKPVGILHLLDDESNFPKATDLSFLEKCHYNHALSELYSRPRMNSAEFAIRHYAGQVWYNVEGFLDKNRDTLRPDVVELLISSKISMVSKMFQHVRNTHEANKTMNKPNGRFVTMKPRTPTVSARFHDSLQQLLESMSQCNPWFVRCIKPNTEKAPMKFDMPCVLEQLRYTGMLETIRIRKTGYPVRLLFGHFVDRYRYLVSTHLPRGAPNKELCRIILDKAAPKEAQSQYQLGLTRVFLRESLERALEYNRALILERAAITVQRYTRGFLARRRFLNISRSTVLIQAVYRGYRERKQFRAMKKGVLMAQKLYRGRKQREAFKILKEEMAKRAEIERASKERAKAKQQREEQERTSRAVAGVNHLEIPAELAFIYSKLDDWQPTHTERNLLKVVGQVIPINYTYNLPSDIDQYQFSKFTNIYFKSHIFGMKREPIKTPFLAKARDQDYTDSLMIFKMILRFMNESNLNGKREQALGDYIVNKGIVNEKLRDEILCQLANQTWKNENDANKERGWLLLSNCLSAFQPSATLFKYFLKYVSDHAYDGYKAYCQRKLLQGERTVHRMMINNQQTVHQVPRNYPPCVLEWRANRNRVNMALNVGFYDGETTTCAIDSWTTCEELANLAVRNHGVENIGWTITLWNQLDGPDAIVTETNGFDYVLDLISEMELAPAFPAAKHMFLEQRKNSLPPIKKREHAQVIRELEQEMEIPILKTFQPLERKSVPKVVDKPVELEIQVPRRPIVPPPQPPVTKLPMRKQSHDVILETTTEMGLSRKSALNDRYFEKEKQRSRSLDNLLQSEVMPSPVKLANLGLSSSKLNERYHSLERIGETPAVSNVEYMTRTEITPERKYSKRALPGSQSSRAYIEKSEYGVKSSAMSDTSEAPSLASHVRRVRVPSQASDVDQFLDELFMPVLDGNLDELSDARSLAASIKGSYDTRPSGDQTVSENLQRIDNRVDRIATVDDFVEGMMMRNKDVNIDAGELSKKIKGGGNMDIPNQNAAFNFTPIAQSMMSPPMMMPMFNATQQVPSAQNSSMSMGASFMPIPIYSMQGLSLPQYPNSPPGQSNDMMAYQQNLQRAFLQSAMAQNIQIQQQLLAQNQALQQLLVQSPQNSSGQQPSTVLPAGPSSMNLVPSAPPIGAHMGPNDSIGRYSKVSFREPDDGELWSTEKRGSSVLTSTPISQRQETMTVKAQIHRSQSPPRKNAETNRKTSTDYVRKLSVDRKVVDRKASSGQADMKRTNLNKNNIQSNFTNVLSELKNRKSSVDSNPSSLSNNKGVPPPPPMPPPLESHDPSESRPFLDPYGRAKTVRIGKWRWPPPSDSNENQGQDSFIEFKMRQQHQQRKLTPQYQEYDQGEGEATTEGGVEWEEFEIENTSYFSLCVYIGFKKATIQTVGSFRRSALEVGAQRPSPGSIGKLKLSSEMRQRLEKVTANHSVRSTKTAEKPALPREDGKVKRLEDNRKLLLEQQLGGRWDDYASTVDDTQSVTSKGTTDMMTQAQVVRTQIERMERPVPPPPPITPPQPPSPRGGSVYSNSQSGVPQPRSPPAPIEPKTRDSFRTSPDSETYDHFSKNQMFSQSRDIFASQQHLRDGHDYRNDFDKIRAQDAKSKDFYSKDSTDLASSTRDRNSDFDSRRDLNSELFDSKYAFDGSTGKRDPFGMTRDVSPKSRDSFGMPSPRDFGVIPNTRESFTVARQSFNKLDRDVDRRSSVASTHRTDKMERIEIEEWPEFLKPVLPPADKPEIEKVQEVMNTKLYPQTSNAHFTYNRVTWTLRVKKEVFAPNETLNSPLALHLVFCQVVYDVLATSSIRITKEDRQNMLKMLDNYGVTLDNLQSTQHKITIKKNVVDMAKQWPLYFARIFPVSIGPQHPETQHVAVSHHGLRLIKRTLNGDLIILETLPLEDIVSVNSSRPGVCVLQIASGVRLPLHTNRAPQLTEMIGKYIRLVTKRSLTCISFDYRERGARPRYPSSEGASANRMQPAGNGGTLDCLGVGSLAALSSSVHRLPPKVGRARTCVSEIMINCLLFLSPRLRFNSYRATTVVHRQKSVSCIGQVAKYGHKKFCKLAYRKKGNFIGRNLSDDDRKTNSPDSLLVKSSESELSSDEYGYTDDSGAFLEQASHSDRQCKGKRNGFIKFFAKDGSKEKKKLDSEHLDVNKNIKQISEPFKKESFGQQKFEYENIPRIDMSKLDQKTFLHPVMRANDHQPTIEQLRLEEGCELRNFKNMAALKNIQEKKPLQQKDEEQPRTNDNLIQELYDGEQIIVRTNGERKLAKMETITEENADSNKLSVREILKRFEELRTQTDATTTCNDEMQNEDKTSDKTLNTIQETLKKLDEKVKSYQIDQKSHLQRINHHENHVSQITKTIQSQANHTNHSQPHNHSNHVISEHENHIPISRVPNHVSVVNQANHQKNLQNQRLSPSQEWRQPDDNVRLQEDGIYESGPVVSNDGKHSLLQYAMLNFRQSTEKFEMLKTADGSISGSLKVIESLKSKKKNKKSKGQQDGAEWTWKEQVDLVKYSTVPIEQSLLRLDADLSVLAVECFLCLMRYMGDQPLPPETSEVKCVYTILMHCHKYEQLRDEVYCQLMKQTTNNKSPNPESCQRGWRIFSIIAAYFTCSEGLRPYLTKYLETAAYDKRRAYHGTAMVCLQNLRKTVKYGGRKNVPSVEEIMAISAGRNAKRQIYRLPGGTERVINTKCTTVVQDVIEEMCNVISVRNPHEMDEFSLYCIVDGDAFTMPLARDEYVLDVTTELQKNHQVFYLIFCRSVWYYPLRLDAALYIEVVFNQIAPDYLEGLLLVLPGEHLPQEIIYDMAQIAALLHRAADMTHEPATKEIKYLLPKTALSLREPRPQQWSNMVQQAWNNVQHSSAAICKAQVLEILSKWPLFGSSFFAVKRVPEGKEKGADHILALNRHGVHFIDLITHETLYHYPYSEVISTRKVKSEEGTLYLDMKCGNLMQQRITRLQTEQAHEISRLIRQYITMEQRTSNAQGGAGIGLGMR